MCACIGSGDRTESKGSRGTFSLPIWFVSPVITMRTASRKKCFKEVKIVNHQIYPPAPPWEVLPLPRGQHPPFKKGYGHFFNKLVFLIRGSWEILNVTFHIRNLFLHLI